MEKLLKSIREIKKTKVISKHRVNRCSEILQRMLRLWMVNNYFRHIYKFNSVILEYLSHPKGVIPLNESPHKMSLTIVHLISYT